MSSFRFLHAADIHLDSPLRGLSRYDGLPHEDIRRATRTALDTLVTTAITQNVDFLIIAGDLYDGDWQDASTGLVMARALGRLIDAGIPVFILRGNHDAASVILKNLPLPPQITLFGSKKAETHRLPQLGVSLHGHSFENRHVPHDLTADYPAPTPGDFNIGVLHTSLGGYEGHEPYAPTSPEALIAKHYDYWALGHIHERAELHQHPHIVYPGVLQGRHIRETGPKGATLVTVENHRVTHLEHLPCDTIRWARTTTDCTALTTQDELHAAIRQTLTQTTTQADGRFLIIRLTLTGATPLHGTLLAHQATLREEIRQIAAMIPGTPGIEKIILDTTTPKAARPIEDDLTQTLADALNDPALLTLLEAHLASFANTLPPETQDTNTQTPLALARTGNWQALLAQAADALHARLNEGRP